METFGFFLGAVRWKKTKTQDRSRLRQPDLILLISLFPFVLKRIAPCQFLYSFALKKAIASKASTWGPCDQGTFRTDPRVGAWMW